MASFRTQTRPALFGLVLCVLPLAGQSPLGLLISGQSRTGFTVQGAGARAMGLGGAFIAVADDATAVSFNPAGLALLLKPEVTMVGRGIQRRVSYEDFQVTSRGKQLAVTDSLIGNTRMDPLLMAATLPLRLDGRILALQLSVQRAFALGEGDSRLVQENPLNGASGAPALVNQSIRQSGQIDIYSFAMAYECSQRMLLGLAVNQWRGCWDLDSTSSKGPQGTERFVTFNQSNQLTGQNFNLGLLWRWPTWSLGLVHRTPFRAEYGFGIRTQTNLPGGTSSSSELQGQGLHWPGSTGVGVAFRLPANWMVTADLEHTRWSSTSFMTDNKTLNGQNFFNLSKTLRVPDATVFRIGAEKLWTTQGGSVVPLRFGFSREPQPVSDATTGEQRVMRGLSLGTGLKRGRFTVDVSYRYGWAQRRAAQFLDVDQLLAGTRTRSVGTERTVEQRVDLSFILQFERQPVERVLRHLFVGD